MILNRIIWNVKNYQKRKSYKSCSINNNSRIDNNVGLTNSTLSAYVNVAHHAQISNSIINDRTSIGRYSKIQNAEIGKYCSVSWDVTIGATKHPIHTISTHAFPYRKQFGLCGSDIKLEHKKVIIENDVWIGCGAIIMPGVHISNGAIIGAGAVVTKDVAAYEIVAGVPAKNIGYRFNERIIDDLLEIRWWEMNEEVLKKYIYLFMPEQELTDEIINMLKRIKG